VKKCQSRKILNVYRLITPSLLVEQTAWKLAAVKNLAAEKVDNRRKDKPSPDIAV
jgi:hypothetical protein